jgi:hypothetical protein
MVLYTEHKANLVAVRISPVRHVDQTEDNECSPNLPVIKNLKYDGKM